MSRYRHNSRNITVECRGDASIDDFETEVLVEELKRRGIEEKPGGSAKKDKGPPDELVLVHETLREGRTDEAILLLEKYLWPKWQTVEACEAELRALMTKPLGVQTS